MKRNHHGLHAVRSPTEQFSQEELEQGANLCREAQVEQFAKDLATARAMWRQHPELVQSTEWKEEWVEPFMRGAHFHPSQETTQYPMEHGSPELTLEAEKWARSMRECKRKTARTA
jgi:hypothetical protein